MPDPITLTAGAIVAAGLAEGAKAFATGVLKPAAQDAYDALKSLALRIAGPQVAQLEEKPASDARAAVVAEVVDDQPDALKAQLQTLADALRTALAADGLGASVDNRITVIATGGSVAAGRDVNIAAPPKSG